jgi:putative YphP/YqiW family bacilliredoxin
MSYDDILIKPMRDQLTRLGIEELRTPESVESVLRDTKGVLMVVINSVCGCAAGNARPAVALAMQHTVLPDRIATVFAGQDREATEQLRSYIRNYPPSSPSIAFFRDGELIEMIERRQIESRTAEHIASHLVHIFDTHCNRESEAGSN